MELEHLADDPLRIFRLDGRVAFLSGATGHLGKSMAQALAGAGAHVVLNGRHQDALEELCADMQRRGRRVSIACFDVTNETSVREHIGKIGCDHERLDIVVNNASAGRPGTIDNSTAADFEQLYRVNVMASFSIIQAAIPLLKKSARSSAGASIVNIASMYGSTSPDPSIYGTSGANSPPYYGAAKAAMIQLTRYMACHLALDRIRVNCLSPGPFPALRYLENDLEFHQRLKSKVPMNRMGEPNEVAGPLLFLASDASSFVTGINLPVDGGWTAW